MDNENIVLVLFIVIMAGVLLGLVIIAINQFLGGVKERTESAIMNDQKYSLHIHGLKDAQPVVVQQPVVNVVTQAPAPAPVVEEVKEEPVQENVKEVVLSNVREPLADEYAKLKAHDKAVFDKIAAEINGLERIRVIRSKYKITAMQGQDKVSVLEIVRGEVRLNCFLVDSDLKAYGKESGNKLNVTKVKFVLADAKDLEAALFTLKVANKKALEARPNAK